MAYQHLARAIISSGALIATLATLLWALVRSEKHAPALIPCLRDGITLPWRHRILLWLSVSLFAISRLFESLVRRLHTGLQAIRFAQA